MGRPKNSTVQAPTVDDPNAVIARRAGAPIVEMLEAVRAEGVAFVDAEGRAALGVGVLLCEEEKV
jgi:hypothetical protein